MSKNIFKVVSIPMFNGKLLICDSCDPVFIEEKTQVKMDLDEEIFGQAMYIPYKKHGGYLLLVNTDNPNAPLTAGVIAHEAYHIMNIMYGAIGYRPDRDNDEAAAYFLNWIVDEVHKVIKL